MPHKIDPLPPLLRSNGLFYLSVLVFLFLTDNKIYEFWTCQLQQAMITLLAMAAKYKNLKMLQRHLEQ